MTHTKINWKLLYRSAATIYIFLVLLGTLREPMVAPTLRELFAVYAVVGFTAWHAARIIADACFKKETK